MRSEHGDDASSTGHSALLDLLDDEAHVQAAPPPRSDVYAAQIKRAPEQDTIVADIRRLYPGTHEEQVAFYTQRRLADNKRVRIAENILRSMRKNDPLLVPSTSTAPQPAPLATSTSVHSPLSAEASARAKAHSHPAPVSAPHAPHAPHAPQAQCEAAPSGDPIEAFIQSRISTQMELDRVMPESPAAASEPLRTTSVRDFPLARPSLSMMQPACPVKPTRLVFATNPLTSERLPSGLLSSSMRVCCVTCDVCYVMCAV